MNGTLRKNFGQRIKALRQAEGLSQEAFADLCGFARSYMSRVERGQGNPSLTAIEVFATALAVDVHELFVKAPTLNASRSPKPPLVPFAADGSYFHPGLTKPRTNQYYVGTKGDVVTFESFDAALACLAQMKSPGWFRPNANGNWSPVKAVRWGTLPSQ